MRRGRQQVALYATGVFSLSLATLFNFLAPLWVLHLGASPVAVGAAAASGSVLPLFLAVPVGGLTDRVGPRAVMLWGAGLSALLGVLYPLLPLVAWLVGVNAIGGVVQTMAWVGAQTYAANASRTADMHRSLGNYSLAASLGTAAAPLLVGWIAQRHGFPLAFDAGAVWALALLASVWLLPDLPRAARPAGPDRRGRGAWGGDFRRMIPLVASPAFLLVMAGTFLRLSTFGIRNSIYPIALTGMGFSTFSIGALASVAAGCSTLVAPAAGWLTRHIAAPRLLQFALAFGIGALVATPLVHAFLPLLALAVVSGLGVGLTLPLLMSVLAVATRPEDRGLAISLRQAATRLSTSSVPFGLGVVAHLAGVTASFYLAGAVLLSGVAALSFVARRVVEAPAAAAGGGPGNAG